MITKFLLVGIFFLAAFLLQTGAAAAQSTDATHPTPIATFPVTGDLSRGTYYYEVRANAGPARMGLTITPPDGGASMSVSLSGPDCCSAEAYVSASAGTSEPIRGVSDPFNIPSRQMILLTIYADVAPGRTVRFSLNYSTSSGSGIVVTPPPSPTPTPSPTPASTPRPTVCTDLAVERFTANNAGGTIVVKGVIRNLSSTPFISPDRRQYVEVLDITPVTPAPVSLRRMGFFQVPSNGSIPFSFTFPRPSDYRTIRHRYRVRIVYNTAVLAADRRNSNDDCNPANDSTDRQLIAVDEPLETDP